MRRVISYIKWLIDGKPMVTYKGVNCGCCGKYHKQEFQVLKYKADKYLGYFGIMPKRFRM